MARWKRYGYSVTAFGHTVVGVVRARDEDHAMAKVQAYHGIEVFVTENPRPDVALALEVHGHRPDGMTAGAFETPTSGA